MVEKKTFSVLIIDNFHFDPEHDIIIEGFPTIELARDYARCIVRSSVEHHRKPNQTAAELRKLWHLFGENATVLGQGYRGSKELDFFIENPLEKELDCEEIRKKAITK